jgi:3-oxoacyl-[acyl-carrier protein] reductase
VSFAHRLHERGRHVASLIAFMVSPRGRWLHGATIDLDGGEVRGL